jgi:hypothetical protein
MPINGRDLKERSMPSLRLSEIDELMLEEDELDKVQLRRKKRREQKSKPYGAKFVKPRDYELDNDNGGELESTDVDE